MLILSQYVYSVIVCFCQIPYLCIFYSTIYIFQSVIFHVEKHPDHPWFEQCVTFNFFPTKAHELAYNLFNIVTMYGIPLFVILAAYTRILMRISSKAREGKSKNYINQSNILHELNKPSDTIHFCDNFCILFCTLLLLLQVLTKQFFKIFY